MKVLIADDESVSRRMLELWLRRWGYEVVVAHDGLQALDILNQSDAPKLLVLDWQMPGKNGVELCREIRKRRNEDYSYVLLLTSKRNQTDVVEGLESGADDFLTKPFNPQELQVRLRTGQRIICLMDQLVAAREELREMAMNDSLTGLWNRAAIIDSLSNELKRSRREGTSLAVIMVDVDHFKSINDTFGHPAGDAVLREIAKTMKSVIRTYDSAGRFGGEEFLILLPGCDQLTACSHAERLRQAISRLIVTTERGDVKVTASFGVSVAHGRTESEAASLIEIADAALYSAKHKGRNRVEFLSQELAQICHS
jgi:two-component system cell cycle response regulator